MRNDPASGVISLEELRHLRMEMVNRQIIARGIQDPLVLEAMARVPRHDYVPPGQERHAYEDGPLSIGAGQTISQPYVVALMTEMAQIHSRSKVLEVGTGSGYQTAILAEIALEVFTVEVLPQLASEARKRLETAGYQNIHFRVGDGHNGWPEAAPFDAIVVTAAPDTLPPKLVDQLNTNGRLVIPIGNLFQDLVLIRKTAGGTLKEKSIPVRFVPMIHQD